MLLVNTFMSFIEIPKWGSPLLLSISLSLAAAGFSVFRFFTGFIFWDPNRSAHDLFISFSHTFAEFAARAFCVWKLFQSFNATNINYLAGEWCYTFRCCRSRKWHGSHLTLFFYVQCLIGTVSPGEYTHTHTHSAIIRVSIRACHENGYFRLSSRERKKNWINWNESPKLEWT